MDIKLNINEINNVLEELNKKYIIFAPKVFKGEGRHSYTDSVRYGEIANIEEVEYKKKSQYSIKEVFLPIRHTVALKVGNKEVPMEEDKRDILIFLRSCDIHAIKRMDNAFAKDEYYMKRRKNAKFVMMECEKPWDTCFCISTGTNKTEEYSLGISFSENQVLVKVKDDELKSYFENVGLNTSFDLKFAEENEVKVKIPHIETWDMQTLNKIKNLPLWEEYSKRCVGCGACNMACGTCTCMHKEEVVINEAADIKEVIRIWGGCQVVKTSSLNKKSMAEIVPRRIRQRVMDKFYNPKLETSKEQVCVGCGRCIDICPSFISFATTVNKFSDELDKIYSEAGMNFNQ